MWYRIWYRTEQASLGELHPVRIVGLRRVHVPLGRRRRVRRQLLLDQQLRVPFRSEAAERGVTEYNDAKSNRGVTFGLQSYERWIALNQSGVLAQTRPLAGKVALWSGEEVPESAIGSATDASRDIAPMVDANHLMLAPFLRGVEGGEKRGGMASSPRYADRRIRLVARCWSRDGVVSLVTSGSTA